jgi:hypothetical protein
MIPAEARGDWPMARHDPRRTAVATGASDIVSPAAYWRFYAGGTIGGAGAVAVDVDGDGASEVVLCTGRKLVAKRAEDDTQIWQAPDTDCAEIVAVLDLDGDGTDELLVRSTNRVRVVRIADGAVVWTEPAGEMGTINAVRAGDLDGDGLPEVIIQDCGTCAVASGKTGFVYRFGGPGASLAAPVLAWTVPEGTNLSATVMTLAKLRAADRADLVESTFKELVLIDGATGAVVAKTAAFAEQAYATQCVPANVDDTPEEELVCLLSAGASSGGQGRQLLLARHDATVGFHIAYKTLVGEQEGAAGAALSMVTDLDADGTLEVVVFGRTLAGAWTSQIHDAASGVLLGTIAGQAAATAPILGGNRSAVITSDAGTLQAWQFVRGATPPLTALWQLGDRALVSQPDLARGLVGYARNRALGYDLDGDGTDELVVVADEGRDRLELVRAVAGAPEVVGVLEAPPDTILLGAWRFPTPAGPRLAVALSDGNLLLLDDGLAPVSGKAGFGARFAGFFSPDQFRQLTGTPVVASLGAGPPGLLVPSSRSAVVRLDAVDATFAVGPKPLWSRPGTTNPVIVPGLGGPDAPGIFALSVAGAKDGVVALDADGSVHWSSPLEGGALADLVWGRFDGDDVPDVLVQWAAPGQPLELGRALSGATGAALWSVGFPQTNLSPSGAAVADWNGDGLDDVVLQENTTRVLEGKSGTQLASGPLDWAYSMPTIYDLDGDGLAEVTLHARYLGARALSHDLGTVLWTAPDDERPFSYAAVLACPGAAVRVVSGSWGFPARLVFRVAAGAGAGSATTLVLAGGARFDDETEARAAGAGLAQLASPIIHPDLAGDGRPKVLVGSTDGWLYALDACDRTLAFAQFFGAPVGSIVAGDTDGDGLDELLVSVADGFLYGLKQPPVAAPGAVRDVDPAIGPDVDVDELVTDDTLHAAWDAVAGAESYQVAVVADAVDGGGFVTAEPWIDVDGVSISVAGLPLVVGRRYFFAVRALAGGKPSPDTLSDGVRVVAPASSAGAGGGGGADGGAAPVFLVGRSCLYACAVAPAGRPLDLGVLALAVLVALGRRVTRRPFPTGARATRADTVA